ncbi:MAG: helix-turn-helix domain-containing protein [Ilumatobacter sp.]|uniref:TetR/AcrR family transcriptional regulator n=1 Tax=Ilumatobacter sp. TaxID=1967498 RepID=UPI003296FFD9
MSSAPPTPKRTRMEPEERREQILDVAAGLFGERPYSEVSVSDIAREADIARGLLHHYFGSKRDLYLAVVRKAAQAPLEASPETALGSPQAWATAVDSFLDAVRRNPNRWLASAAVGGAESDDDVAAILDETREILADQTLLAIGLGDRADDPVVRALVRAWGGFVQELTVEWVGRGRIDDGRVRRTMLATLPILIDQVLPLIDDDTPESIA